MKTIQIKKLELTNFKGIKSLTLENLSDETNIFGDNGTGKTTVFDAFTWLLFGKDSSDRKDFEIKTLDKNNNVIPKIDHEVSALIEVDNMPITLRRIFKEKWQKKRGSLESEFTGNETLYEWNGVPMSARDYSSKISQIVDESVFKLITSTTAFNALKWQSQRDVLIELAGNITNEDIALGNEEFQTLLSQLVGKSFDEYKKQLKASVSKTKQEIKVIPTRIDEVQRNKPEAEDFDVVRSNISRVEKNIEDVHSQISDKAKAHQSQLDEQKKVQGDIHQLETEVSDTKYKLQEEAKGKYQKLVSAPADIQRKIEAVDRERELHENDIKLHESKIDSYKRQVHSLNNEMQSKRDSWESKNAETFAMSESDCKCPTCNRAFDEADIQEKRKDLEQYFISNKNAELQKIEEEGQSLKKQKETIEGYISESETAIIQLKSEIKTLWEKRADLSEQLSKLNVEISQEDLYEELLVENKSFFDTKETEINKLRTSLTEIPKVDNSDLQSQLAFLTQQLDGYKSQLLIEDQIKAADKRVEELSNEERELAQTMVDLEKELFVMDAFEKAKSDRIESTVNSMFKYVDFKLFETQINGGEVPTCKALIKGVPFSDANTASKINAGLDIINTLCNFYKVNAPIFIDNRESVVELIDSDSQIINLIVSKPDKKLRVEHKHKSIAI